jgi:hypothetical protein
MDINWFSVFLVWLGGIFSGLLANWLFHKFLRWRRGKGPYFSTTISTDKIEFEGRVYPGVSTIATMQEIEKQVLEPSALPTKSKPRRGRFRLVGDRLEYIEDDPLVQSIPTLLADMDSRREEIIQRELDRRISSGDTNFVLDIIRDVYAVLVGDNLPELPAGVGNEDEDAVERFKLLMEFIPKAKNGVKKVQEQTIKRGEEETGLLIARSVNRYISIEDELENDSSYKKLKKKLKTAREHLPGAIASNATKAIDNYLDASKAYKATVIIIIPLVKMLEENDLLKGEPFVKQIIDIFQRYREQYVKLMNEKLAKVNEALGD